jgi:hypothetical protein
MADNVNIIADGQPSNSYAITVSDSTDLSTTVNKGIMVFVSSTATIAFKLIGDSAAHSAIFNVPGAFHIPGRFSRVMSTGTTLNSATIVGFGSST